MPRPDDALFRPPEAPFPKDRQDPLHRISRRWQRKVGFTALVLALVVGWLWWSSRSVVPTPLPQAPVLVNPAPAPEPSVATQPPGNLAAMPATDLSQEPLVPPPLEEISASNAPETMAQALERLFGSKLVLQYFLTDDWTRRLVVTVDNLTRSHAASRLWPVAPTAGRFMHATVGTRTEVAPDNALRYTPYVLMLETVDLKQLARLYVDHYGELQKAYEDLGFPGKSFHHRLLQTLDHLVQTPVPNASPVIVMPEVRGPHQPERPWVMWRFEDPALDAASAGQKILLRMGSVSAQRVQKRLLALRRLISVASPAPEDR